MVSWLKQKPLIAGLILLTLFSTAYLVFFILNDSENKGLNTSVGKNWEIEGTVKSKGQPEPKKNLKDTADPIEDRSVIEERPRPSSAPSKDSLLILSSPANTGRA